jgi:hypothetical protein
MVTYEFYTCKYNGRAISEEAWCELERDASAKLNQYKRQYTVTAPEEASEAMAVCAMAEALDYFVAAQNGTSAVQSASIGSVSVNYGNMSDKYVIKIDIKTKKQHQDMEIADKCLVQLMLTDPEIRARKQIVKTSEKTGLYLALDIADAWLTRALSE